jgi:hypothetical protein
MGEQCGALCFVLRKEVRPTLRDAVRPHKPCSIATLLDLVLQKQHKLWHHVSRLPCSILADTKINQVLEAGAGCFTRPAGSLQERVTLMQRGVHDVCRLCDHPRIRIMHIIATGKHAMALARAS